MRVFRILLLEDNAEAADIVTRMLEGHNFDVTHAADGRTGMIKVKSTRFDLILCDLMMPGIDGWRFLERAADSIGQTPVVITTALSDRENVVKGVNFQVAGYLVKPIRYPALMEKVLRALKITDADLIRKQDFPFRATFARLDTEFKIVLSGIPDDNSAAEFAAGLTGNRTGKFTDCAIESPKEFAYSLRSADFLEKCVTLVTRELGISTARITLGGPFLRTTVAAESMGQSRVLAACKKA